MGHDISDVANGLAQSFLSKEKRLDEAAAQTAHWQQIQRQETKDINGLLDESGKIQFVRLAEIIRATAEQINAGGARKMIIDGGGDSSHVNVQYDEQVLFVYFKYLRTNGDGTGPCIDCYFGRTGEGIGNNGRGKVGSVVPFLVGNEIVWGEAAPSASNPIGSIDRLAEMLLSWFHSSNARLVPGPKPLYVARGVSKV